MIGEDLTPFFVPGEFAGIADTLNGVPVVGILDEAFVSIADGIGMAATRPAYHLASTSLPADPEGLTLVASGKQFRVATPQPDGTGVTTLLLEQM
jgi:hypothetical protein